MLPISKKSKEQKNRCKNLNKATWYHVGKEEFMINLSTISIFPTILLGGFMILKKCYISFGHMELLS
jgi:hypothetical protein